MLRKERDDHGWSLNTTPSSLCRMIRCNSTLFVSLKLIALSLDHIIVMRLSVLLSHLARHSPLCPSCTNPNSVLLQRSLRRRPVLGLSNLQVGVDIVMNEISFFQSWTDCAGENDS